MEQGQGVVWRNSVGTRDVLASTTKESRRDVEYEIRQNKSTTQGARNFGEILLATVHGKITIGAKRFITVLILIILIIVLSEKEMMPDLAGWIEERNPTHPLPLPRGELTINTLKLMPLKIIPYNPILKERARQLRQNMTPGEVKLWQHLKGKQMCGYDFDRQRPIDQYIVDFYCKRLMLAIEIDGSSHDSQEAQQRDEERQARLESLGVRFLRFREEEVCREIEGVLKVIEDWVNSPPGRG